MISWLGQGCAYGDQITLRDLTLLNDVEVSEFDVDGIRLVGDRVLTWDQIQSGQVADDQQAEFDRILSETGLLLHRLRWRLQLGDDEALLACSTPLLEIYRERSSETAAMVWYGELRGQLARGNRAAALAPLLALMRIQRAISDAAPQDRFELNDREQNFSRANKPSGLFPELLPVWFDEREAAAQFESTLQFYKQSQNPSTIETLYVASLAIAAGESKTAQELISSVARPTTVEQQWIDILRLQSEARAGVQGTSLERVDNRVREFPTDLQALAYYCLGRAKLVSDQPSVARRGLLDLLRIPAEFPRESTDLSGAALATVATVLEANDRGADARRLWRELATRYPQSWHARRRRGQ